MTTPIQPRSTSCRVLLGISIALLACKGGAKEAESAPTPKSSPTLHDAAAPTSATSVKATAHARQAIETQLACIKSGDGAATTALFSAGAVALAGAGHEVDEPDLCKTLGRVGPHDTVTDVKLVKLVVGGTDTVAWLFADLAITKRNQEPGEKVSTGVTSVHATELLDAASGWKVVAAAFSESRAAGRLGGVFPMIETTASGPLAALVVSPAKIAASLATDSNVVAVTNEKDFATGAEGASGLLTTWSKRSLSINGSVREIRNEKWGFVQANVDWNEPGGAAYRFSAQLIALPRSDGSWSVVAVQYLAL